MILRDMDKKLSPIRPFFVTLGIVFLTILTVRCGEGRPAVSGNTAAAPRQEALHPHFTITMDEFLPLFRDCPPEITEEVRHRPRDFLDLARQVLDQPQDLLVLVDKKNALPPDYEPHDLVYLRDHPIAVSRRDLRFREAALPALLAMARAARADGVELLASSAYRSYSYQKTVYERIVRELGQEEADRESARPGHSQHQLGTVIDFGSISDAFTGTPMQRWLQARGGDFGFSLSFPEGRESLTGYRHESWHFRYIGPAAARMEREFFGGIQQYLLQFWTLAGPVLGDARIPVPTL